MDRRIILKWEIVVHGINWIYPVQVLDRLWATANMAINLRIPFTSTDYQLLHGFLFPTACLLAAVLVGAHHDGTAHHEKDEKSLILLEIQSNGSNIKDKRSPQQGYSQAVYGASPGQFVVRTSDSPTENAQPDVPPEYLNLLQQLVTQQQQTDSLQPPSQPVLQQLLISR